MSFEAKYKTKIKFLNGEYVKEAISMMVKDLELDVRQDTKITLENMSGRRIRVKGLCFKAPGAHHPVDIYLNKNNELEMQCGDYDRNLYSRYLDRIEKQFYPAVVMSHKTGAKVNYNTETKELELLIAR